VSAPYRSGIVICADKREIHRDEFPDGTKRFSTRDDVSKIIDLGKFAVVGATGNPAFPDEGRFSKRFDVMQEVTAYYKSRAYSTDSIPAIQEHLTTTLTSFLNILPRFLWPTPYKQDDPLFLVVVFDIDQQNRLNVVDFTLTYKAYGIPKIETQAFWGEAGVVNAFGELSVWREIKTGSDQRFNVFRRDPLLRRFVVEKHSMTMETRGTALAVAKRTITATHEGLAILTSPNEPIAVSETSDCACIRSGWGFHWMEKDGHIVQ